MKINEWGFLTLLGILISLVISCIVAYFMVTVYLNRLNPEMKAINISVPLSPASYNSIAAGIKQGVEDISARRIQQLNEVR